MPGVETDTVFVEVSPGVFASRAVHAAARFNGQVRLNSGLKAGELVVTDGALFLNGASTQ